MSLYDRVLSRTDGGRTLAVARLKRTVLSTLHRAFGISGIESQSDLARRLRVRRSAVNQVFNGDGNLRISTLAEYLYEMGCELEVRLVRVGEPRAAALEGRATRPAIASETVSASPALAMWINSGIVVELSQCCPWTTFVGTPRIHTMMVRSWNLANAGGIQSSAVRSAASSSQILLEEVRSA